MMQFHYGVDDQHHIHVYYSGVDKYRSFAFRNKKVTIWSQISLHYLSQSVEGPTDTPVDKWAPRIARLRQKYRLLQT